MLWRFLKPNFSSLAAFLYIMILLYIIYFSYVNKKAISFPFIYFLFFLCSDTESESESESESEESETEESEEDVAPPKRQPLSAIENKPEPSR